MGTDPIFLTAGQQSRTLLFQRYRLPCLLELPALFCTPVPLLHSRLLLDDQSCAPASDAARGGRLRPPDEISEPVLRTAREQKDRAQRYALGRPLSVLSRCLGALRARVLPVYRAESGPGRHGLASGRLSLVKLCRAQRGTCGPYTGPGPRP